jgi:predicted nucleic acid-binding protein
MNEKAIYFDSSIILSMLFVEDSAQQALDLWQSTSYRISSFLLYLETMTVLHRVQAGLPANIKSSTIKSQQKWLKQTLGAISLYQISSDIAEEIERNNQYGQLRALDAIHIATAQIFASAGVELEIATFDKRMSAGARNMGISVVEYK